MDKQIAIHETENQRPESQYYLSVGKLPLAAAEEVYNLINAPENRNSNYRLVLALETQQLRRSTSEAMEFFSTLGIDIRNAYQVAAFLETKFGVIDLEKLRNFELEYEGQRIIEVKECVKDIIDENTGEVL